MLVQPIGIFDIAGLAVRMHYRVIPGRYRFAMLMLARIPRRRDVDLRSLKDNNAWRVGRRSIPNRIRTCDMSDERSKLTARWVEHKGNVVRNKFTVAHHYPSTERVRANQRMENIEAGFFVHCWNVHAMTPLAENVDEITPATQACPAESSR